jgi:hypothetical protein
MTQTLPTLHENLHLIEVTDRMLLDMILADRKAKQYIVRRLSEQVAIVAPGQFDKLLARLRKLGHTPKVLEESVS